MCGILGFISKTSPSNRFNTILDETAYRGPDEQHRFQNQIGSVFLQLGMNRLSIVNTSKKLSPFISPILVVFNGEIWNATALKKKLGLPSSATEIDIIRAAFLQIGPEFVKILDGMYAIGIFDQSKSELFLYRDPIGIKPLYFIDGKDYFIFGSELPAIHQLNPASPCLLNRSYQMNHFIFGFSDGFDLILPEYRLLTPGHLGKLDDHLLFETTHFKKQPPAINTAAEFQVRLSSAIEKRYHHNDIYPIGLLLSGGLDSSLLALMANRLGLTKMVCIFIGDESHPDFSWAKYIADVCGYPFVTIPVTENPLSVPGKEICKKVCGELGSLHLYYGFAEIKRQFPNLKVVWCGEGADEVLGGYTLYKNPSLWIEETKNRILISQATTPLTESFLQWVDGPMSTQRQIEQLIQFFRSDQLQSNHLIPFDHLSMANSIEVRVPFLDQDLFFGIKASKIAESLKHGLKPWIKHCLNDFDISNRDAFINRKKQIFPSSNHVLLRNLSKQKKKTKVQDNFWPSLSPMHIEWDKLCHRSFIRQNKETGLFTSLPRSADQQTLDLIPLIFPHFYRLYPNAVNQIQSYCKLTRASKHASPLQTGRDFIDWFCRINPLDLASGFGDWLDFEFHLFWVRYFSQNVATEIPISLSYSKIHVMPFMLTKHYGFNVAKIIQLSRFENLEKKNLYYVFRLQKSKNQSLVNKIGRDIFLFLNKLADIGPLDQNQLSTTDTHIASQCLAHQLVFKEAK